MDHEKNRKHDSDPIAKSFRESGSFNEMWLTTSRPLSNAQRLGFILLSTLISLAGSMFFRDGISLIRGGDMIIGIMMAFAGSAILVLGVLGLWRVSKDVLFRKP